MKELHLTQVLEDFNRSGRRGEIYMSREVFKGGEWLWVEDPDRSERRAKAAQFRGDFNCVSLFSDKVFATLRTSRLNNTGLIESAAVISKEQTPVQCMS